MSERQIRVFLIERDSAMRAILSGYIALQNDIVLCGQTDACHKALRMLGRARADVVLLDLGLLYLDGLELLRLLPTLHLSTPPRVVVRSTANHELLMQEALALGADCFLPRLYPLDQLMDRVRAVFQPAHTHFESGPEAAVLQLMAGLHGSQKLSGCGYFADALMALCAQSRPYPRMDQIYEELARKNNVSYSAVESAMRKAVQHIFAHNSPMLREVLAKADRPAGGRMSNSDFLFLLAAYLHRGEQSGAAQRGLTQNDA